MSAVLRTLTQGNLLGQVGTNPSRLPRGDLEVGWDLSGVEALSGPDETRQWITRWYRDFFGWPDLEPTLMKLQHDIRDTLHTRNSQSRV